MHACVGRNVCVTGKRAVKKMKERELKEKSVGFGSGPKWEGGSDFLIACEISSELDTCCSDPWLTETVYFILFDLDSLILILVFFLYGGGIVQYCVWALSYKHLHVSHTAYYCKDSHSLDLRTTHGSNQHIPSSKCFQDQTLCCWRARYISLWQGLFLLLCMYNAQHN